jgi:hypothetical protein
MAQIKNIFSKGTVQKDLDERFVSPDELIDSENAIVITSEGSNAGVLKNVTGNIKKTNFNIPGAKTIGKGTLPSKNKVYNFISGNIHDYIIETDVTTWQSVIVVQSTVGKLLNFNPNKRVTNVDIIIDPEGNGDLLCFSGDNNPPRCLNIQTAKNWGVDGFSEQEISLIKAPPLFPITFTPLISTENPKANFLEDRFLSFAYRYKYTDGQYSAISTWSEYFFIPGVFNLDFDTFENLGMLNIYNAVNLTFNTGATDVVGLDLLFKLSNEYTPYVIDKFIKADEDWGNNQDITLEFNNSKVYGILPESEFYRSYDNVPHESISQAIIGNRIAYANYLEDRDLIDSNGNKVIMDYSLELIANNVSETNIAVQSLPINYNYGGIPITLDDGLISFDLSSVSFIAGSGIFIDFDLKSNSENNVFKSTFIYTLVSNYANLNDFFANSDFLIELQNYTFYFENNGGIVLPFNYVPPYVVEQGFDAVVVGDSINITFPVIKYEILGTPSNTFIYDYFYDENTFVVVKDIVVATSLKSLRSYEICMLYRDAQGRKTTALTSVKNTLFIPNENSITQNQIKVIVPTTQLPPTWADTYKFGIKFNKQNYETIPINIFFVDGIFRWIKIDGENINKIKEGQILLVKRDANGPVLNVVRVKVLELKQQPSNFLTTNAITTIEPSGLYAKIQSSNYQMEYGLNEFVRYQQNQDTYNDRPFAYLGDFTILDNNGNKIDRTINQGSTINFNFSSNYSADPPFVEFVKTYIAQRTYDNFEDFFNIQVVPDGFASTNYPDKIYNIVLQRGNYNPPYFTPDSNGFLWLIVEGTEAGNGTTRRGFIDATLDIRYVSGIYVFETTPIDADQQIFYETPEVYKVISGQHEFVNHTLTKTYNCFCQGNGVESFQIRDAFNERYLNVDFVPTAVSEDEYRQVRRFKDITYSGIYNSTTNVNELNAFNLSLANFKDDMESNYGPIYKMRGKDTNLEVCQEDRDSIVFYGKDMLFNADGTTNLSRIQDVLGQQKVYEGEYGISTHTDSYDYYENTSYHTDFKRGVVVKKGGNGLFEISALGMRTYFKKLFRDNTINEIIGRYDQFYDYYLLNIKYTDKNNISKYVTWAFSDKVNGWLTRITFNPEDMTRINSHFVSFKNGEIWLHNQDTLFNTFYGVQTDTSFQFNFSQEPSARKIFKALSIEGTTNLQIACETDLEKGYVNNVDFEKKEGVYYAYVRGKNGELNTSQLSFQGIGECVVNVLTLEFAFELDSILSVGDVILNSNLQIVGTVLSKTSNSLTLDTVNNIVSGDYVLATKPESVQKQGILGYFMKVGASFSSNTQQEIYAINSEVIKSYM